MDSTSNPQIQPEILELEEIDFQWPSSSQDAGFSNEKILDTQEVREEIIEVAKPAKRKLLSEDEHDNKKLRESKLNCEQEEVLTDQQCARDQVSFQSDSFTKSTLNPNPENSKQVSFSNDPLESSEEAYLSLLISTFGNFTGSNMNRYLNLPAEQKRIIFQIQSQFLFVFDAYQCQNNDDDQKSLEKHVQNFLSSLSTWKSAEFSNTNADFDVDQQMEMKNNKCFGIISLKNLEFLKFIETRHPLVEILYLLRVANAICQCLCNFSFEDAFSDEF